MGTDLAVQRNPQMPVVEGLTENVSSKTQELAAPRVSEGGPMDQGLVTDDVRILSPLQQPGNYFLSTFPPTPAEDQRGGSLSWEINWPKIKTRGH